jgi:hypothetical protein
VWRRLKKKGMCRDLVVKSAENDRNWDENGQPLARNQETGLMASQVNTQRVRNGLKRKGMAFALVQKSEEERGVRPAAWGS